MAAIPAACISSNDFTVVVSLVELYGLQVRAADCELTHSLIRAQLFTLDCSGTEPKNGFGVVCGSYITGLAKTAEMPGELLHLSVAVAANHGLHAKDARFYVGGRIASDTLKALQALGSGDCGPLLYGFADSAPGSADLHPPIY
jgi:hypothetical protein